MPLHLSRIKYCDLNARQKENYNFLKVSAVLADYGFITMRLSDDWQGADFIAQHVESEIFMKVQLKGRLYFEKNYLGKDIYIAFPWHGKWYLYPHDELLEKIMATGIIKGTRSWEEDGWYHFPKLSEKQQTLLELYKIED
jgi:hypothetical protein